MNGHPVLCIRQPERGQGLIEYALILVLVAVVVIVILALLGPSISGIFGDIACAMRYSDQTGYQGSDPSLTYEVKLLYEARIDSLVGDRTPYDDSGEVPPDDEPHCWIVGWNATEFHAVDLLGKP